MKKISFDIDEEVFSNIKEIVKNGDISQGQFLREAVSQKIDAILGDEKYYDFFYLQKNNRLGRKLFFAEKYKVYKEETILSGAEKNLGFVATGVAIEKKTENRFRIFSKFDFSPNAIYNQV